MNTYYLFLIEASFVWLVLLVFYALAFRGNRQWVAHRRFLLFALAVGAVLPLLPSVPVGGSVAPARLPANLLSFVVPGGVGESAATTTAAAASPWEDVGLAVYWLGVILGLCVTGHRLARHLPASYRASVEREERFGGFRVVRSPAVASPYAAFRTIYLPVRMQPELETAALLHEAAHLRANHPFERLTALLFCLLLWFNPLTWLYARLLARVHEFEADAEVVRTLPARDYGRQLLQATQSPSLVPALFSSPIKQRITMLTQPNKNRRFRAGHWIVLLLLLTSLFVACTADTVTDELAPTGEVSVFDLVKLQQDSTAPQPVNADYPTFLHAIYSTIRYPQAERYAGVVGTVSVEVRLDKDGKITGVSTRVGGEDNRPEIENLVVTGYDERVAAVPAGEVRATEEHGLDEEVERAIREIGGFHPATKDGIAVPANLVFDVTFNLEN